jgi:hypothetical protein
VERFRSKKGKEKKMFDLRALGDFFMGEKGDAFLGEIETSTKKTEKFLQDLATSINGLRARLQEFGEILASIKQLKDRVNRMKGGGK